MKAYDAALESKVLKTICDNVDLRPKLLARTGVDYFGAPPSREIFRRIVTLAGAGRPIPSSDILQSDLALSDEARVLLISPDVKAFSTDEDLDSSINLLSTYRKARIIHDSILEAVDVLKQAEPDIDNVITKMESALSSCYSGTSTTEMVHYCEANIQSIREDLQSFFEDRDPGLIPTGFSHFDKESGGFGRGDVVCFGAPPAGGKTLLALQMAGNQYQMGYNVCFVTFEMSHIEVKARLLAAHGRIDHGLIRLKKLTKAQQKLILDRFEDFLKTGYGNRFTIWCPTRDLNIPEICLEIKAFGYDSVYIDYLGLLKGDPKKAMWENLGDHARTAKIQAHSLNCVMNLLVQYDDEENKIKYSKAIVAHASFIWVWSNGQKEKDTGIVTINQLKARSAGTYDFLLQREFNLMTFKDFFGPPPISDAAPSNSNNTFIPNMPEIN
jgi:replicative DNA helicase